MQSENNRVENEIKVWMSKEDKLKFLFNKSPSIERSFGIEKLKFFRMLLFKYKKTKSLDELITLRFVKHEYKSLSSKVYPKILERFLHEVLNAVVFERKDKPEYLKEQEINRKSLEDQLSKSGFHDCYGKVIERIKEEQSDFSIPVSYYVSEKERLEHSLYFSKDEQGAYQLTGFGSTLHSDSVPYERSSNYFKCGNSESFNVNQAYNLLAGRAVFTNGVWKQFDLCDKDKLDNYRIREFPEAYGYNVENVLSLLPLKNSDGDAFYSLSSSLREGKRVETELLIEGREVKTFIEANPRFKSMTFYNDRMQKISLKELERGCKIQPSVKPEQRIDSHFKKKSLHL